MTPAPDIPVVCFVGKSGSGKTTVLEGVIGRLASRGWRVATVKHHAHGTDVDTPRKDSWRHARAGAVTTMVSGPAHFALVRRVEREPTLAEIARIAAETGCDLLIAEGFKREGFNRIEVVRSARSCEPVCAPDEVIAFVTDVAGLGAGTVPAFGLAEAGRIADFIEERFLAGPPERGVGPDGG